MVPPVKQGLKTFKSFHSPPRIRRTRTIVRLGHQVLGITAINKTIILQGKVGDLRVR